MMATVRDALVTLFVVVVTWIVLQSALAPSAKAIVVLVAVAAVGVLAWLEIAAYRLPNILDHAEQWLASLKPARVRAMSDVQMAELLEQARHEWAEIKGALLTAAMRHPIHRVRRTSTSMMFTGAPLLWCYDELRGEPPDEDKQRVAHDNWRFVSSTLPYPDDPVRRAEIYYDTARGHLQALIDATRSYRLRPREATPTT